MRIAFTDDMVVEDVERVALIADPPNGATNVMMYGVDPDDLPEGLKHRVKDDCVLVIATKLVTIEDE